MNWKQSKLKQTQTKKQANKNQWESYQAIVDKGKISSGRKTEVLNNEDISFSPGLAKAKRSGLHYLENSLTCNVHLLLN